MTLPFKKAKWLLLALLVVAVAMVVFWPSQPLQVTTDSERTAARSLISERPPGGDFTLATVDGERSLSDYEGKLVLLYFGYTFCPDICPTNLSSLSQAWQNLTPAQQEQVKILFVSVDPERDTLERLQNYSDYFHSDITGMTGTPQTLAEIAQRYGVVYQSHRSEEDDQYYAVDHSAFTYVIKPNGELAEQLPHATAPQTITQTVRKHLD
ncbi:MAG: SCO family protein [Hydrogenovibrio sp.]|uniref:SCO family protein n=1 Tax=Hydrogenovibrio sp. TaxID=2065821 RepID=UPI0028700EC3|nr:SCO family protein [Hydrogenovibrio sp.]MDR9498655.1 SCO family protein [Hydrogenovibrio sp.]